MTDPEVSQEKLIEGEKLGLPQHVRITSEGKYGLDVKVHLEDGRELPCVADIKINMPLDGCPRATIEVLPLHVDIVALADIFVTTIGGKRYRLYPVGEPEARPPLTTEARDLNSQPSLV